MHARVPIVAEDTSLVGMQDPHPKDSTKPQVGLVGPVHPLEGQRVRIVIALMGEDIELATGDQTKAWNEWVTTGPSGSIEVDGEPEFPHWTRRHRWFREPGLLPRASRVLGR